MALTTLGGQLLRVGQQLALSAYCCCTRWCRQTGTDACGNPVYGCGNTQAGSIGECTPDCKPREEPCECGPDKPCEPCFECIDRKCVRIEDCCVTDADCGPCQKCVNGVCEPCGPCEQCINGACVPCGPCQRCEGGVCIDCDIDQVCIDGVCVPKKYYCCWEDCPNGEDGPVFPPPATACREAIITPYGYLSPCGMGEDDNGEDCDLTKSGPFISLQSCEPQCERHSCVLDACGNRECMPDPNGPYTSMSECLGGQYDNKGKLTEPPCIEDPCATPCTFGVASGPGIYTIDACERDICVSYVSLNSRPIRVQIWGPTLDANCNIIATRVIKADSDWRCEPCCDCPDTPPRSNGVDECVGGPKGQITWRKPRGVTYFEVATLEACGGSADIIVKCSDDCGPMPDPDMCECEDDGDCNEGCHCCPDASGVNRCGPDPCGCEQPCNPECEVVEPAQVRGPSLGAECYFYPSEWKTSGALDIPSEPAVSWQWKPGYPNKISGNGCTYFWHFAQSRTTGQLVGHPFYGCCGRVKFQWKLYMCDGEQLKDITGSAVTITCQDQPIQVDDGEGGTITQYPECVPCLQPGRAGLGGCLSGEYCFGIGFGYCNASCLNSCDGCLAAAPDSAGIFDPPVLNCPDGPP